MNINQWNSLFSKSVNKARALANKARYKNPWGPYRKINKEDKTHFNRILSEWKPQEGKPTYIIRWLMTEWCNYACSYCSQNHNRHALINGYTAHAFDNHPLEKWIDGFKRHFSTRQLSLVITGGEPMLDQKNMIPLLTKLTSMPTVECIRIDTNSFWNPNSYKHIDTSRIILMCTYHPEQTTEERFINKIKKFIEFGFQIGMVNFVMNHNNFNSYLDVQKKVAALGVPLHPNPLSNSQGFYSKEDLDVLAHYLPNADYRYRTQIDSPLGKKCLFPALAYQMNQNGNIYVGCHKEERGSFFYDNLPDAFAGPVPCPSKTCLCLDMYSFLEDVNRNTTTNPLKIYSDMLKK